MMRKTHWGEHLDSVLDDLFYNPLFIEDVEAFRKTVRLPTLGLKSKEGYERYRNKSGNEKKIQDFSKFTARKFNLPPVYALWIESFVGIGFNSLEYVVPFFSGPIPGHAYSVGHEKDHAVIRVYKGATHKGLKRFIDQRWDLIKNTLDASSDDGKAPNVRSRAGSKKVRDKMIFKLRQEGKLKADGHWGDKSDIEPKYSSQLTPEHKKKIIYEQISREKIFSRYKRVTNREPLS